MCRFHRDGNACSAVVPADNHVETVAFLPIRQDYVHSIKYPHNLAGGQAMRPDFLFVFTIEQEGFYAQA